MTKLEWCRANAPTLYKNLSDAELVKKMGPLYEEFVKSSNDEYITKLESVEYSSNAINEYLDYMVLELNREFGNSLAFKGGYMLTKLMSGTARQTTDIDFSILTDEIYDAIKNKLVRISDHFINVGIIDTYKIKETIQPTMSGGVDMYKDGKKILGVDVGWHDIEYGTVIRKLNVGNVNSFEIERMLADKITAILSRKRFRRPKDLYDLYCISECMEFDAQKIADYILRRTGGVGADWDNIPFSEKVLCEYEKAYNSLQLRSIYKDVTLDRPRFNIVIDRFYTIAQKVKNPVGNRYWNPKSGCFVNKEGKLCQSVQAEEDMIR